MNVAVYCSARTDIDPRAIADAQRLGTWLGANGNMLVYGGLKLGLMDVVATATAAAGGKVMGIVPQSRIDRIHPDNTISIPVATLHERKQMMEENAHAFVALDGGYGTLDEVLSALASGHFFNQPKPILLLDRDGLYQPLAHLFRLMTERHLASPEVAGTLELFPDIETLIQRLQTLQQ